MRRANELFGRCYRRRGAATPTLPLVALALIEEAVFDCGDELLRRALVVRVISFASAREGDPRAVMKVVVPEAVESVAAALKRSDKARLLRLVLGDDCRRSARRRLARLARERGDDVVT